MAPRLLVIDILQMNCFEVYTNLIMSTFLCISVEGVESKFMQMVNML